MVTSVGLNMAVPTTQSVSQLQHAAEQRGHLNSDLATRQVDKEIKHNSETVVEKEDAAFYHQNHDAKEESKNKYANLYSNKKKPSEEKKKEEKETSNTNRMNFDIKI